MLVGRKLKVKRRTRDGSDIDYYGQVDEIEEEREVEVLAEVPCDDFSLLLCRSRVTDLRNITMDETEWFSSDYAAYGMWAIKVEKGLGGRRIPDMTKIVMVDGDYEDLSLKQFRVEATAIAEAGTKWGGWNAGFHHIRHPWTILSVT